MTDREAFEMFMYGYLDKSPRVDVQWEVRQSFKAWQEACKYKAASSAEIAEAAMSDANKYDIAEAIRDAL